MKSRFSRKDFLEALFGEYVSKRDGFVRVMTVRQYDRKVSTRYFPKLETLAKEIYPENQHVFFGVCPHENMKADKANIRYLVALWAGLDLAPDGFSGKTLYFKDMSYAAKAVRSFPVPPSIVVESGWGVHLYWLLKGVTEIQEPQRVERILTSISEYFQCKKVIPLDSVLRLPDTFNGKQQTATVKCAVKYLNTEFRYDLAEFEKLKLLGAELSASEADAQPEAESVVVQNVEDLDIPVETSASEVELDLTHAADLMGPQAPHFPEVRPPSADPTQQTAPMHVASAAKVLPTTNRAQVHVEVEEVDDAETILVMAEGSADTIADEIVEKVVLRLTGELMDKMVDRIVEKLYQRITNSTGHK
jgi:hypothetical protein